MKLLVVEAVLQVLALQLIGCELLAAVVDVAAEASTSVGVAVGCAVAVAVPVIVFAVSFAVVVPSVVVAIVFFFEVLALVEVFAFA